MLLALLKKAQKITKIRLLLLSFNYIFDVLGTSKSTLNTKNAKHNGIANSVRKDGTSKIVELVLPTLRES